MVSCSASDGTSCTSSAAAASGDSGLEVMAIVRLPFSVARRSARTVAPEVPEWEIPTTVSVPNGRRPDHVRSPDDSGEQGGRERVARPDEHGALHGRGDGGADIVHRAERLRDGGEVREVRHAVRFLVLVVVMVISGRGLLSGSARRP